MKKLELLSQVQILFSPQNAYLVWVEGVKNTVGVRFVRSIEETQNYLDKIESLEQKLAKSGNDMVEILSVHAENVTAIKLFLTFHLSVWTSRVFRFDKEGNETKIGNIMMEEAEKELPKLDTFIENDHILHIKLTHIYCQIRLLHLDLQKNMDAIDRLFREAEVWKRKCGKTRECMHFRVLLGASFTSLSFRANRYKFPISINASFVYLSSSILKTRVVCTKFNYHKLSFERYVFVDIFGLFGSEQNDPKMRLK